MDALNVEHYINAFLVEKGVRDAYLIQNCIDTDTEITALVKNIQLVFPSLKLFVSNNYYFLATRQLQTDDVNSSEKIAKILRFDCDVNFDDLDRETETTDYNVDVYLNGKTTPITLITYVCQTDSKRESAERLVDDVRTEVLNDPYLKTLVNKVELKANVTMPTMSFVSKLLDLTYTFNEEEIQHLDDIVFNVMNETSCIKIVNAIDYMNPIHRGIMLGYISDYQHNVLDPLYPLQSTGYMKQIYDIENKKSDLMVTILQSV